MWVQPAAGTQHSIRRSSWPVPSRAVPRDTLDWETKPLGVGCRGGERVQIQGVGKRWALRDAGAGSGQGSSNGSSWGDPAHEVKALGWCWQPTHPSATPSLGRSPLHTCPCLQMQLLQHDVEQEEDSLRELGDGIGECGAPDRGWKVGLEERPTPALEASGGQAWLIPSSP